jgi:phospholipid N-methyltransferase
MQEGDELDICEIDPDLAKTLERDVLRKPPAADALDEGRIRLHCCPVQDLEGEDIYDYIVSGLPLTSFDIDEVMVIMNLFQRVLKPDGTLSYFEYVGLRRLSVLATLCRRDARIVSVSSLLDRKIARHQVGRVTAMVNFPPAHVRYFRFPQRQPAEVAG